MDTTPARQLCHGAILAKRGQCHLSLEVNTMSLSHILRWSRLIGQFGGLAKLGSGCRHAVSFIIPVALYASSGVRPANVECGRRVL
jgi:hypothetical protein